MIGTIHFNNQAAFSIMSEDLEGWERISENAMTAENSAPNANPIDAETNEVLREWRASAFYWQKHANTIRAMFGPVTQALIQDAQIKEGESVLDVAGGAGEPSLTIAEMVGPTGSVTYTDAAPEMVAAAESEAQRRGLTNVMFKQCLAESLPFESQSFDAVVCRFGAMFFPDPVAALREILRVTKHDGVISLAVWGKSEVNPFSHVITNIVTRYCDLSSEADPNASGAFRFAKRGSLAQVLTEAGAVDIKERMLQFNIAAPISLEQFWEMRSETSGTLREKLATLSASQAALLAKESKEAISEFFFNNQMSIPAEIFIVTAHKT